MKRNAALVALVGAVSFSLSYADESRTGAGAIRADKLEQQADQTLVASGNVVVVGSDFRLQADSVELRERGTGRDGDAELTARGNVILTRGQESISFKELRFSPRTGKGTFELLPTKD
jgi:lipopolysaccharide export system protein LptA